MREIKFKGWNTITKTMVDLKAITVFALRDNLGDGLYLPFSEKIILLQFIGRYDKNKAELYDGDICKNGDWEDDAHAYNYRINVIEWDEHNAMWMGWNPNIDGMTCEKIGSIFENPELLEQKDV